MNWQCKKVLYLILTFGLILPSLALAAGPFDGKWIMDVEKMASFDSEFAALKDNPALWEETKAQLEQVSIEINVASGTYVETFMGGSPNSGSLTVISQDGDTLLFRPNGEEDVFVITLVDPGHMKMTMQGGNEEEVLYFKK